LDIQPENSQHPQHQSQYLPPDGPAYQAPQQQASYTLTLSQKLTVMKNQWTISRVNPAPADIGVVAQKRMSLKESVTCKTLDGTGVLFQIKGRKVLEIAGTYDVFDGTGAHIASISKDFKASLGRSTYQIETPFGRWTLTERSQFQAILRRVVRVVADIPWLMRVQFVLLNESNQEVGYIHRANFKIKDTYEIHVADQRLDQRVASALGVAADAFMNR
jgi:uncharacterized protein YxjI